MVLIIFFLTCNSAYVSVKHVKRKFPQVFHKRDNHHFYVRLSTSWCGN